MKQGRLAEGLGATRAVDVHHPLPLEPEKIPQVRIVERRGECCCTRLAHGPLLEATNGEAGERRAAPAGWAPPSAGAAGPGPPSDVEPKPTYRNDDFMVCGTEVRYGMSHGDVRKTTTSASLRSWAMKPRATRSLSGRPSATAGDLAQSGAVVLSAAQARARC